MRNSNKIYLIVILFIFSACHRDETITKINIDQLLSPVVKTALESGVELTKFSFCELIPNNGWDNIIVIGPYSTEDGFKALKIQNFDAVKHTILSASLDEGKCTLVYIKNNKAIAYSIVKRSPIDFAKNNAAVYTIKRSDCNSTYLKKINASSLIFQVGNNGESLK
jgi:hypothetical protein